jgi:hypothetical protein
VTFKQSLVLLVLASSAPCFGQVSISPEAPTVLDMIRVQVPISALPEPYGPGGVVASMASNKITVALRSSGFHPVPPNSYRPLDMPIGRLPAGAYQVEVTLDQAVIGTTQFTISPRPQIHGIAGCPILPCGPLWVHSDMWWSPMESGWGASLVQHGFGPIFGVFFIYAANGTATWYVLPGGHWSSTTEFDGDLYQTRGPQLDAFDAQAVGVSLAGSAALVFSDSDPDLATLSLTISGKTIRKSIQRMSY